MSRRGRREDGRGVRSSRKRGQKEGSLYQRASDGLWCAAVSLGNGRRKVLYGGTFDEVLKKRDGLKLAVSQGAALQDGRITVGRLFEAWLAAKRPALRPKTYARYASLIRCHLGQLAQIKLAKVTAQDVEAIYRSRSDLAPKTIRHLHAVVKAGLTWAVRREMIARNPAALIAPGDLPRVVRREMTVLSVDQVRSILRVARDTEAEGLVTFALVTGARIGEIMGVKWDRVNLETGRVRITHSLQYLDGKPVLVEPKTRAAARELVLPAFAVNVLRAHRARQNERALSLGSVWTNTLNLVFVTETGGPLNRHAVLRQYLRPLLVKAGIPSAIRVHDLRHGAASLMLAQGIPVPVVAELLGHATPAITMAIYSHALPDSQQLIAAQMESTFGGG